MAYVKGISQVVNNLSKFSKAVITEVVAGCEAVQAQVMNNAKARVPVWTGNLQQSIQPGGITITDDNVEAIIEAIAPYASYVEFGTGAFNDRGTFFPNVKALEKWAGDKLGDPRLAYVVARSIFRRGGMPAKPFLGPALIENLRTFKNAIRAAIKRAEGSIK